MFKTTAHDFGTVACGSKQQFAFEFENLYKDDVHVVGVRSSCGCTSPSVTKDTLKSWETSTIVAVFNTKTFLGQRGATVTVIIDRPQYAEVQLKVSGHIRSDVELTPDVVDFGSVTAGEQAETQLAVTYHGWSDWQLLEVHCGNKLLDVTVGDRVRGNGLVTYTMAVRLKPGAPAGHLHDQLTLVTNDSGGQRIAVTVEGQIVPPLTVSPASLSLGALPPGGTVQKRLVVHGQKPFRILSVQCDQAGFQFAPAEDQAKTLHFVTLDYTAGQTPGEVAAKIKVATDLGSGLCGECLVTGTVKPAP